MKSAISISIGSSKRDKIVEMELLGESVRIERRGTDGDMAKAAQLYTELSDSVDAFGVGGADLGLLVDGRWFPMYSALKMIGDVKRVPLVDGTGLKNTLERQSAKVVDEQLGGYLKDRKVFIVTAVDRWGMTESFVKAGYDFIFGDLMFALGLPIPVRSVGLLKAYTALLMPVAMRLPFEWLYPTGEKQEVHQPKWERYFHWATVIAGDCHYIRRHMPDDLQGKVIVTNTTTPADQAAFRAAGVKFLVTTTPVLDGRSFGTNMMEAALVAASGRREPVDYRNPGSYFQELQHLLDQIHMVPQVQEF